MINALTVDVEDNHRIVARNLLGNQGPPTEAVLASTSRLLQHFADRSVRGTFFVLGEVAASFPGLIRAITDQGHEVGVHGFYHHEVFKLTREQFRQEVSDTKSLIEDLSGAPVRGHRAPTFSITADTGWAFDVLVDVGFGYDSSILPVGTGRYGWAGFPLDIHEMTLDSGRSIIEAPLSTVTVLGRRLPACGGGYLRHFPYWYTEWAMRRIQRVRPAIVYVHPYEIDTSSTPTWLEAELAAAGNPARFYRAHQRRNRHTVEAKLLRLLDGFRFAPLVEIVDRRLGPGLGSES
jgi:polysaccharide deacetylase family protein (PEP-CTERM system associated)